MQLMELCKIPVNTDTKGSFESIEAKTTGTFQKTAILYSYA
jgi:hypothetical protein